MYIKHFLVVAYCAAALSVGANAQAAEFKSGDFLSFLRGTTSTGDIYAAGQNIALDQNVQGDALLAGMNVRVTGETSGSVMAAGSYVDVLGKVGHAVRALGSRVNVDAEVRGDALLGGGMVYVPQGAVIHGDLLVGAGTAVIDGTVLGNVKVAGGQIAINGDIRGSVDATVDDLTIGDNAKIGGKLKYAAPKMARIASTSTIAGGLDYTFMQKPEVKNRENKPTAGQRAGIILLAFITGLVLWLVASFVGLWMFKERITAMSNLMINEFAKHLGWGFVWLVVLPVACLVLFMTVIGATVGVFAVLVYLLTILIAKVVTGMALGLWLMRWFSKDKKRGLDWKAVLLGVFILQIVMLIPIVGWVAAFVLFLAALGAVVMLMKPIVK